MTETDERFIDRMEHDWVHDIIPNSDDADHLFALARRGAAVQWRPIEEAPRDGTYVLISNVYSSVARYDDGDWMAVGCEIRGATHFMPLPPPPKGEQE